MSAATPLPAGDPLPVDAALPALRAALREGAGAVLQAPPGAGKTTRVPLALLGEPWAAGRIVMLEPRRLAARGAAARMAETLGEAVGETVGFRIRGETRVGRHTRVEVVTEGVLTRMLQADPALDGVSAVIFDEIHERSLNADLGLALCLETQGALRPELRLLAMSATLDAAPVAATMGGAPILTAEGRAFDVETLWAEAPLGARRLEEAVSEAARTALAEHPGDLLVFLPGVGEIMRTAARLEGLAGVDVLPLHGDLAFARQQAALAPAAPGRRKAVLATAVAETSLTVAGVRIVLDAGLARRARFDPGSGMARLVTEKASRAEADQRRGRAGRTAPGVCLRLWTKGEHGARPGFAPPEIMAADLAPLALEIAAWGAPGPEALALIDQPPAGAYAEARALLAALGALDGAGRVTAHGRAMAALPTHPRLAHMALSAPPENAAAARALAGLLSERDPLRRPGAPARADMALRLEAFADPKGFAARRGVEPDAGALARARETARRLGGRGGAGAVSGARAGAGRIDMAAAGRLLALAYPDRIARRRPGDAPRYLLSGGKGAALDPGDALAGAAHLVVADTDGDPREARIRLAATLSDAEIGALAEAGGESLRVIAWDRRARAVVARTERRLGALTLETRPLEDAAAEEIAAAMAEGVRLLGLDALPWSGAAAGLRDRVRWAAAQAPGDWPDWTEAALLEGLEGWLGSWLAGCRSAADLAALPLADALREVLGREALARLDRTAPAAIDTPAGARAAIDYGRAQPTASVRVQALYGFDRHPAPGVTLELLSPAGRPIATTADLPGFWRGAWADARRDMRGRYPRHDWPEAPQTAAATLRAKPRK
ncbi:ATP-dependent helicase HrpB [Rubrimonas cliftonensis]|uniref:ATP-dependent helicase HrpB n=1 Tax=Rubrimonas cliftonensis TaxID=89524 RepID=A0A1H4G0G8_9RHOB|nr:ATP-dependent helicase HrpB [Rubrimonas cliftonensis]SEB03089.1 ATP-dependent helicase HrpB [Rubrimonas cliftonensis]